jgi:hypothetical protein
MSKNLIHGESIVLSSEEQARYEQIRQMAQDDLAGIDREIEMELGQVKKRLLELQDAKRAVKQILDGACKRLGTTSPPAFKELNLSELNRQGDLAKA